MSQLKHHTHAKECHHRDTVLHDTVVDPVCGMRVNPATSPHRFEFGGTAYHFCSARCLEKFSANPDQYLNSPRKDPAMETLPEVSVELCGPGISAAP